jgi:CIC family chloride channel protein
MGPGHNGIDEILAGRDAVGATAAILFAKIAASIACVGSGFRGGLFSASLFLGATLGCVVHGVVVVPLVGPSAPVELSVVAGMAGVAASIIGTPIAIVLLAVETAGLHTGVVTTALSVAVAGQLTRRWFGYSFSTWRFHVRGRDLLGPRDIGRLRGLRLADVPLEMPPQVSIAASVAEAAAAAAGSTSLVVAVAGVDGRFAGLVRRDRLLEVAAREPDAQIGDIAVRPEAMASADDPLADHVDAIDEGVAGEVPVLDPAGRLVGIVAEAAMLRRYLTELLAADRDDAGPITAPPDAARRPPGRG